MYPSDDGNEQKSKRVIVQKSENKYASQKWVRRPHKASDDITEAEWKEIAEALAHPVTNERGEKGYMIDVRFHEAVTQLLEMVEIWKEDPAPTKRREKELQKKKIFEEKLPEQKAHEQEIELRDWKRRQYCKRQFGYLNRQVAP
jgi:hypothetical protein